MTGGDDATFGITGGELTLAGTTSLNFESAKNSYSFTVQASDGRGGSDTVAVTLTVTDVNEPPSAPAKPTVSATPGSSSKLEVSWPAPANTGPPIDDYD